MIDYCDTESYADMKNLWKNYGGRVFLAVCTKCHRFVKPFRSVYVNTPERPNANCSKCGKTTMHDMGWIE